MTTTNKHLVVLPELLTPHLVEELFDDVKQNFFLSITHLVVDFSKLKSIDLKSFNVIINWLHVFKISGKKVAIYGIMPHIAVLLANYNVTVDYKILRNYDETW